MRIQPMGGRGGGNFGGVVGFRQGRCFRGRSGASRDRIFNGCGVVLGDAGTSRRRCFSRCAVFLTLHEVAVRRAVARSRLAPLLPWRSVAIAGLLPLLCVVSHSRRQSKARRAARRDARRFSSGQGCPVCRALRRHRTCGLVIQNKSIFLWLLLTEGNPDGLLLL